MVPICWINSMSSPACAEVEIARNSNKKGVLGAYFDT
jgi:hypothetical protein